MTLSNRYLLEINDLLAFRLNCQHCRASLTMPFKDYRIPGKCPSCQQAWFLAGTDNETIIQFIESIKVLSGRSPKTDCQLQLEVNLEQPEKGLP